MSNEGAGEEQVVLNGGFTTIEGILIALSHPWRRSIIYYLQENQVATIEGLAQYIAEENTPSGETSATAPEQIMIELAHNHLPKLADSFFIEYDQRSRTVSYSEPPVLLDEIVQYLARLERELDG